MSSEEQKFLEKLLKEHAPVGKEKPPLLLSLLLSFFAPYLYILLCFFFGFLLFFLYFISFFPFFFLFFLSFFLCLCLVSLSLFLSLSLSLSLSVRCVYLIRYLSARDLAKVMRLPRNLYLTLRNAAPATKSVLHLGKPARKSVLGLAKVLRLPQVCTSGHENQAPATTSACSVNFANRAAHTPRSRAYHQF